MAKSSTIEQFETRKSDHIRLALREQNQAQVNDLNELSLKHEALPDLNFDEIDISSTCLQKEVEKPFFISSMTAGHAQGTQINHNLAIAAEKMGWAMGVGSQRRQLTDPAAAKEWITLRELAPEVTLFGNIGLAQIIDTPIETIQQLVDSIQAAGMIIHLNPLQECLQPEGTPHFRGGEKAIATLAKELSVPVIIKETGCGFSQATIKRLLQYPLGAIDVSGLGGTHWGRIEGERAQDPKLKSAADTFKNWGISTAQSLVNAMSQAPACDIWASGGVRSGLDAAKLLALGANMVGFAKPMLEVALQSDDAICDLMREIELELKIALFCTGSVNLAALGEDKICL